MQNPPILQLPYPHLTAAALALGSLSIPIAHAAITLTKTSNTNWAVANGDLNVTFTKQPLPAKHGKTTLALSLSNAGNIPATGPLQINIETSPDGLLADATPLPAQSKKISLKPDTKPQKITLPVALPAGTYFLLIQLDPQNTFHDINLTNNLFTTSLPLTVA